MDFLEISVFKYDILFLTTDFELYKICYLWWQWARKFIHFLFTIYILRKTYDRPIVNTCKYSNNHYWYKLYVKRNYNRLCTLIIVKFIHIYKRKNICYKSHICYNRTLHTDIGIIEDTVDSKNGILNKKLRQQSQTKNRREITIVMTNSNLHKRGTKDTRGTVKLINRK